MPLKKKFLRIETYFFNYHTTSCYERGDGNGCCF